MRYALRQQSAAYICMKNKAVQNCIPIHHVSCNRLASAREALSRILKPTLDLTVLMWVCLWILSLPLHICIPHLTSLISVGPQETSQKQFNRQLFSSKITRQPCYV